jgi:hypothetical protein
VARAGPEAARDPDQPTDQGAILAEDRARREGWLVTVIEADLTPTAAGTLRRSRSSPSRESRNRFAPLRSADAAPTSAGRGASNAAATASGVRSGPCGSRQANTVGGHPTNAKGPVAFAIDAEIGAAVWIHADRNGTATRRLRAFVAFLLRFRLRILLPQARRPGGARPQASGVSGSCRVPRAFPSFITAEARISPSAPPPGAEGDRPPGRGETSLSFGRVAEPGDDVDGYLVVEPASG